MTAFDNLKKSFIWAGSGLWYALKSQRNMQIHAGATVLAQVISFQLKLPWSEVALVLLTCALVLVAEMLNTALETTLDVLHPGIHPQIKIAKDVAAGAVLLAALLALLVGGCLWLPRMMGGGQA